MVLLGSNTNEHIHTAKRTALNELLEEEPNNYNDEFSRYMAEFQIIHVQIHVHDEKIMKIFSQR